MIAALILAFLLGTFVFYQLMSIKRAKGKTCNDLSKTQRLKYIPNISIYVCIVWLLTIGKGRLIKFLTHIGQRYTIFETQFLSLRGILVSDYRLGKELFNKSVFCGKPTSEIITLYAKGAHGTFFTSGDQWKEHRRFSHHYLKEFGFNTHSMEVHTQNEIDDLIKSWCDKNGETFSPHKEFYIPILSTIWVILAGERASSQNQKLVQLVCNMYDSLSSAIEFPELLLIVLPLKLKTLNKIINWIPIFPGLQMIQKSIDELLSYMSSVIRIKKESMDMEQSPSDLMQAYIKAIATTTDVNSGFYGDEGELNLLAVACEFFVAGGDTTASTLAWCMLHLIRNPEVQEKIRADVEAAVGVHRRPFLSDRPNCPYTQAFLWEVLRFSPFASVGLPHQTTDDTSIGQHFVKKGTMVVLNIYSIQHDPKIWGDPENFRPERFLSPDGKTFIKPDAVCAFSLGQRRCPGEQLALDNLFLFVSSICQRFILKPDPTLKKLPEISERRSLFHVPNKFNMIAVDRFQCINSVS